MATKDAKKAAVKATPKAAVKAAAKPAVKTAAKVAAKPAAKTTRKPVERVFTDTVVKAVKAKKEPVRNSAMVQHMAASIGKGFQ